MALKPEDPASGFKLSSVVAYINEKIAIHEKGSEFYLENMALSWEEVEDKLKSVLEDSAVSSKVKDACAWGGLALGVRFARRQSQLQEHRVKWLHDLAKSHKSAAQTLASDLKALNDQKEIKRREAAFRLRLAQDNLAEVQKELHVLRWKLLQAAKLPPVDSALSPTAETQQITSRLSTTTLQGSSSSREGAVEWPRMATGSGAGTENTSERERVIRAGTPLNVVGQEIQAESVEARKEVHGGIAQILRALGPKNYRAGLQGHSSSKSGGKTKRTLPGAVKAAKAAKAGSQKPKPTASPTLLPIQLPPSFTYPYPCLFPPLTEEAPSFPPVGVPTASPARTTPQEGSSEVRSWADEGAQGTDPVEKREKKDPNQQKKPTGLRRPGDWDCPWCKAVNFSRRETCYRCGRAIWLQNPQ